MKQMSAETQRELVEALGAARGYMMNAHIDLTTGAPKKTALATISGGIKMIDAALAKARAEMGE